MVAPHVTIHLEFNYNHSTRSTRPCARPDCAASRSAENMNIHNIPTTHDINTYTKTIRRKREPGSDQYQTQPRHDTTSTPASRLTLGGFSDNGTSSPTCSRFRDRGSKPVRHHTQLKARIRLGRISSVLLGGCARLGGSYHTQNHTMAHGTTAEESAMQQLGPDDEMQWGREPNRPGGGVFLNENPEGSSPKQKNRGP